MLLLMGCGGLSSPLLLLQVRFMGLAFGGKDLVFEEDPNLNLRKVHYHLIRDKGLSLVSRPSFAVQHQLIV